MTPRGTNHENNHIGGARPTVPPKVVLVVLDDVVVASQAVGSWWDGLGIVLG